MPDYHVIAAVNAGSNPSYGNEIADVALSRAPEPASLLLLDSGLLCLGVLSQRRR